MKFLRLVLLLAFLAYLFALAICLVHLIQYKASIGPSLPLVLITEPWSSLFGMLLGDVVTNDYMDGLSITGVGTLVLSGCINATILWFLQCRARIISN